MRRLSLLTRLAIVGLVAALVVLGLGGLGVARALSDVRGANVDADRSAAALGALPLVRALQRERIASVLLLSDAPASDGPATVPEARLATDGALDPALEALGDAVGDPSRAELAADVDDVRERLEGLERFREAVSSSRVGPADVIGHYTATIQELLDVPGAVGQLLSDAEAGRQLAATSALHRGVEQVWLQEAQLTPSLGGAANALSDTGPLIAAATKQSVELGSYQILASEDARARFDDRLQSADITAFTMLRDEILAERSTATVGRDRFLAATGGALSSLEDEEVLATTAASEAFEMWRAERRGALVRSLVLFALALAVLAGAVLVLARWVAEPVGRFADDAQQLASGLPHLLTRAEADPQRTGRPIDVLASPMRGPLDRLATTVDALVRLALDGAYRRADLRLSNRNAAAAFADALSDSAARQVELLADLRELEEEPTRIAGLATAEELGRQMGMRAAQLAALSDEAAKDNARPVGLRELAEGAVEATGAGDRVRLSIDSGTVSGRQATAVRMLVTALLESALEVGQDEVRVETTQMDAGRMLAVVDGGNRSPEAVAVTQGVLRGESATASFSLLVAVRIARRLKAPARFEGAGDAPGRVVVELPEEVFASTAMRAPGARPEPVDAPAPEPATKRAAAATSEPQRRDEHGESRARDAGGSARGTGPSWSTGLGRAPAESGPRAREQAPEDGRPAGKPSTSTSPSARSKPSVEKRPAALAPGDGWRPSAATARAAMDDAEPVKDPRTLLSALEGLSGPSERAEVEQVESDRTRKESTAAERESDVDVLLKAALSSEPSEVDDEPAAPEPAAAPTTTRTPAGTGQSVPVEQRAVTVQALLGAFQDALQDARL